MTGALEWLVAGGPNQGASFSLGPGKVVVGSGDEADVILSDKDVKKAHLEISILPGPGEALTVKAVPLEGRIRIDGTLVEPQGADLSEGQVLALGISALIYKTRGADWGEVELVPLSYAKSLAEAASKEKAEGRKGDPEVKAPDSAKEASPIKDAPQKSSLKEDPLQDDPFPATPPEADSGQASKKPRKSTASILGIILATLLLGLLVLGPSPKGPDRLEELRGLLDAGGFERLSVSERGKALEASGTLDSDEELARLVELVKSSDSKVFLRISVRRDLLEAGREALASYGFYPAMSLSSDGRPMAAVYMRDREVEERAFAELSKDVPSLDPIRTVVHRSVLEPVLRQELSEEGLGFLEPSWGEGLVTLPVPPGFQGASALARAFQKAAGRTGAPVVYALVDEGSPENASAPPPTVFEAPTAPIAERPPPPGDPENPMASLDVAGVTLSPMRFVSTRDGQRLFEGSPLPGGWVITAIEAESLTLSREDEAMVYNLNQNGL